MVSERVIFLGVLFFLKFNLLYFGGVFTKTIIPLALVGYEMIIANSYTLFQNGCHFSVFLFACKLAIVASFKGKYSFVFRVYERGNKG